MISPRSQGGKAMGTTILLSVAVLALAGAESSPMVRFDYDLKAPLDVQVGTPAPREGAGVRELTYLRLAGGRTGATLVTPEAPGRHPGVLFVHWYESDATNSNRTQFLDE